MIKDTTKVPEFLAMLDALMNTSVHVGIFSETEDAKLLMIANVHEFGVSIQVTDKMRRYLAAQGLPLRKTTTQINIPERSYIRSSFDEQKGNIEDQARKLLIQVLELRLPPLTFFDVLGGIMVSMVQEYMVNLSDPPNHPFTIERKGSSNPLIDTGRLVGAVTHKVVN